MITILIDIGSTHSFLDPEAAKLTGLLIEPAKAILVSVADGNKLVSTAICNKFVWSMQGHQFQTNMRLLTLGGFDMVLGVDWMKTYSPLLFYFDKLQLTFKKDGKEITLTGGAERASLRQMTAKALKRFILKNKQGLLGQLFSVIAQAIPEVQPDPSITTLLQQFPDVFQEPKGLPPVRKQDHTIPLKLNTEPVAQRPYRVPYVQKAVIEKLVAEMLKSGIIQPSQSPFSSPMTGDFVLIIGS